MIRAEGITVAFDGSPVLREATLAVEEGQTLSLLGPSGSGKSTLLRVIAGLQEPQAGRVLLDGRDVTSIPPHERGIGMVFQAPTLFPHRNVGENVAFGLRIRNAPSASIDRRVRELLMLVGLDGFEDRRVGGLSGGEAQRVALARALAPAPRALLLDEPLSALDGPLRERLRDDLAGLFESLDVSVIHVTHDVAEAFQLGDVVAVMHAGAIVQTGTPDEIWSHPRSPVVATVLGMDNVTEREVTRAEAVGVIPAVGHGNATVLGVARHGAAVRLRVRLDDGGELTAFATSLDHPRVDERVDVTIDPAGVVGFA